MLFRSQQRREPAHERAYAPPAAPHAYARPTYAPQGGRAPANGGYYGPAYGRGAQPAYPAARPQYAPGERYPASPGYRQPAYPPQGYARPYAAPNYGGQRYAPVGGYGRWRRGQVLPPAYRGAVISDFGRYHLRRPPRGYYWVQQDDDFVLVAMATGLIFEVIPGGY